MDRAEVKSQIQVVNTGVEEVIVGRQQSVINVFTKFRTKAAAGWH